MTTDYENFIKFLKKERVYRKFVANKTVPNSFLEKQDSYIYLSVSFVWEDSPEGFGFWSDLYKKWIDFLNKKED